MRCTIAISMIKNKKQSKKSGFTLVELVIVVAVIAILAAIGYVAYGGAQDRAREAVLSSDLTSAAELLNVDRVRSGGKSFPADMSDTDNGSGLPTSADTIYYYTVNNSVNPPEFCLTGHNGMIALHITHEGKVSEGVCDGDPEPVEIEGGDEGGGAAVVEAGALMQEVTSENCPSDRVRTVDARDSRTYWVQRLDEECWMLTNLAYAGGGVATYGDTVTLSNGSSDGAATYTAAKYYVPPGANVTSGTTDPSTSTTGTGQYGYLYNWCGAMGGQLTAACANTSTPSPNSEISICPSGWRLPTGGINGEFDTLNTGVNGGSEDSDDGLRTSFLAQRGGAWGAYGAGFAGQGSDGVYWSSSQVDSSSAYGLFFGGYYADPTSGGPKNIGASVRCVAV